MVMVVQGIATGFSYSLKLVVGQITEGAARGCKRIVELVVGIIHLIDTEYGFQTAFIKRLIMGHEWQTFYQRFYLRPYIREYGGIVCIFVTKTMHLRTPIVIIVRLWLDERVERIHNLTIANNNNSNRANAAALIVSRFKIYSCKVLHCFSSLYLFHILFILPAISLRNHSSFCSLNEIFYCFLQKYIKGTPYCGRGFRKMIWPVKLRRIGETAKQITTKKEPCIQLCRTYK